MLHERNEHKEQPKALCGLCLTHFTLIVIYVNTCSNSWEPNYFAIRSVQGYIDTQRLSEDTNAVRQSLKTTHTSVQYVKSHSKVLDIWSNTAKCTFHPSSCVMDAERHSAESKL